MRKLAMLILLVAMALASCTQSPSPTEPSTVEAPTTSEDGASEETNGLEAGTEGDEEDPAADEATVTLRVGLASDTLGMDPHLFVNKTSTNYTELLYDSLLTFDESTNIAPGLAESYEQIDDVTWTFNLREDVTFHDGKPLTAEDVKYSLERIQELSPKKALFAPIETVDVVDQYTVQINLSSPFGPLLTYLALPGTASIVDQATVEANGDLSNVANGTGPFKLVEWQQGSHTTMVANEGYFVEDQPIVDELIIHVVPDEVAASARLRAGELDWIELYSYAEVEALRAAPGLTVMETPVIDWKFMLFNTSKPPFDDVKVRQAIAMGLDRQQIVDTALFGLGQPAEAGASAPPGTWAYVDYPLYDTPDADAAQGLLQEAGYGDGFPMTIRFPSNWPIYGEIVTPIQAQLQALGIDAELEAVEFGVLIEELGAGQFDAVVSGWAGKIDPDEQLYEVFHSEGALNWGKFSDPEVDDLLEQGRAATELEERQGFYFEAQRRLMELSPELFLIYPTAYFGMSDSVTGFTARPDGSYRSFARVSVAP